MQPIDIVGPAEVFAEAANIVRDAYEVEVVAPDPGSIVTRAGYSIVPRAATECSRGPIDTLLLAGGPGVMGASQDGRLLAWIRAAAERSRRVASVCSGAFLCDRRGPPAQLGAVRSDAPRRRLAAPSSAAVHAEGI